jgi:hypothetical protein
MVSRPRFCSGLLARAHAQRTTAAPASRLYVASSTCTANHRRTPSCVVCTVMHVSCVCDVHAPSCMCHVSVLCMHRHACVMSSYACVCCAVPCAVACMHAMPPVAFLLAPIAPVVLSSCPGPDLRITSSKACRGCGACSARYFSMIRTRTNGKAIRACNAGGRRSRIRWISHQDFGGIRTFRIVVRRRPRQHRRDGGGAAGGGEIEARSPDASMCMCNCHMLRAHVFRCMTCGIRMDVPYLFQTCAVCSMSCHIC